MSFGREKRLLLGWMALLAPIPLPFNTVLEWPVLFVYALFVIFFMQRVERGAESWLPNWALNLLGLAYLPVLALDLWKSILRGRPVVALLHLIMFLILAKLYSIRREKDKWHLVIAAFFLFVGAMATSSHLSIGLYLVAFLILSLLVLGRFAYLHVLAGFTERQAPPTRMPIRAPLAAGALLVVVVAIPIFATMPRLYEPYIMGRGGTGGLIRTTGFSDSVDLNLMSTIRSNRSVALRVKYSDTDNVPDPMRFKGATYDRYEDRRWHRMMQLSRSLRLKDEWTFELAPGTEVATAEIFRERLRTTSLILPIETLAVTVVELPHLSLDVGGAAVLPGVPRETIRYEAHLGAEPVIAARLEHAESSPLSGLDQSGVTGRMAQLAREVMGEGSDEERIDRLERYLLAEYSYTLDFQGRDAENPVEAFLFEYRSGHCTYFASAMVLVLRSAGIPARLATGFLGAEYNPIEGYYVVRQQNAHAWVEAFTPARGWRVYDPTPPEGRPVVAPQSLRLLASQFYDYLTFRWDRYILTYGADDQADFFASVRTALSSLWQKLTGWMKDEEPEPSPTAAPVAVDPGASEQFREPELWQLPIPLTVLLVLFAGGAAWLIYWNRRPPLTAEAVYRRLRAQLERAGIEITDSLAPLRLEQLAIERYPRATRPTRRLVALYLRESFGGEALDTAQRADLLFCLQRVVAAVKIESKKKKRAVQTKS
ncbi:MAG: DUF3488 domain-containing transglutaminase family protein [bacterium]|nr:DUF3488 domain-containing transglutaminase family protein [bacterium]